MFFWGKLWLFGLFSGYKSDYIDVWMIKITIKTNQVHMDVCFFQKVDNIQKPCLSLKSGFFSVRLLVCEFKRQTWYQKFMGTDLPLENYERSSNPPYSWSEEG